MTIQASEGETNYVQEYEYEGETKVDGVLGNFINRRKSYNISFQIGFFISHEEMK